ncbi:MAG: glycosyltransferase family 4 protein [Candidatus Woesearchaeota archaeon]|jgi:glycosyltransferase involved in cell wall biosynthesis
MKIIVFSPTSTILTLEPDQPLGGADSGLLRMIEELGIYHEVIAFVPVKKMSSGVGETVFIPFEQIFDLDLECDLFIHYRKVWVIPNNIHYKTAVFYSQDTVDTPCFSGLKGSRNVFDVYSRIWVLSEFHKQNMKEMFDIPDEKFFILGNAADPQPIAIKKPLQFIYASTPFRGLDVLLKAWTFIIEKYPEATLHIFSSMKIYGAEQLDDLHFGKMFNDMKNGRFKGLVFHGTQSQKEMLKYMNTSFMLLYPNTYPETFCNVIMEARACRTPFITTDLGALRETGFKAGCYIEGNARTHEYLQKFLDILDFIIKDDNFYKFLQNGCYPIRTFEDYKEDLLSEINKIKSGLIGFGFEDDGRE